MKRKFLCLVLAILLLSSALVGCNDTKDSEGNATTKDTTAKDTTAKDTTTQSEATVNADPVTITYHHVQGEWIWPIFDEMGKMWNEKTGNTVEFIYTPAEDSATWLNAQFMAGTEPDIVGGQDITLAGEDYANGKTLDLKPFLNEVSPYTGEVWKDSFLDGVLGGVIDPVGGDAMLGIPTGMVTVNLYYNRDIFKEFGIPDEAPDTWGDVLAISEKIQDSGSDIIPFSIMNGMSWNLGWMVGGFLDDVFHGTGIVEKLDIININDRLEVPELVLGVKTGVIDPADPRFLAYFTFMKKLSKYFNKGFNSMFWEYEKLFNEGRAAMQINGSWYPNQYLTSGFDINYGTGNLPQVGKVVSSYARGYAVKYAIGLGTPDLRVTTKAQEEGKADAAIDYLRFLTDPQSGAKYWVEKTMFLPVIKGVEVPDEMEGIVSGFGTEIMKTAGVNIFNFTPEAAQQYQDMLKVYLEDNTTPEEFIEKVKVIILESADQYIEEKPEMKVQDFIDKVQK